MTLYLIDPTTKFTGTVTGSMSAPGTDVPTTVDYSGHLYNNDGENLTLEAYKAMKGQPHLVAVTWEELAPYFDAYKADLQGDWKEITEQAYECAWDCLPPQGWRDLDERFSVFYIQEAYTADLHDHYVYDRQAKKFYSALRSRHCTNKTLLEQLYTR